MKIYACKPRGFTLVEMAIVLVIIGLLLGGMLIPLSAQMDDRQNKETQKVLDEINQALIGFALVNGYLPCPAKTSSDGTEDRTGTACTVTTDCDNATKCGGFVPWATLGISQVDSWGRLFRYSVTPAFTNSGTKFSLSTPGLIDVKNTTSSASTIATNIPALVMSHGKNGYYATPAGAVSALADGSATNTDEGTNGSGGMTFVSKTITGSTSATGGEFDDIVAWVSPNTLFNRMVSAGKLP